MDLWVTRELEPAQRASSGFRWASTSQAYCSGIQFVSNAILAPAFAKGLGLLDGADCDRFASLLRISDVGGDNTAQDLRAGLVSRVLDQRRARSHGRRWCLPQARWWRPSSSSRLTASSGAIGQLRDGGPGVVHQAMLQRSLQFRRLAVVDLLGVRVRGRGRLRPGGRGVWSLVYQALVLALVSTVLLWVVSSGAPAFEFHWGR